MGNFNSSQFDNISGGASHKTHLNNMNLKEVQNKIVQMFSHIGIMNKNADVKKFLQTIVDNTNPTMKELNSAKNHDAISNLKDFMVEGLGMDFLKSVKDPMVVLKTSFQLLNSIVNSMSADMSKFRSNLETNVESMSNLLNTTQNLIQKFKYENKESNGLSEHKVSKLLNVLDHLVKMLKTQKDFVSILLNSSKLKDTENDIEKLVSKDFNMDNMDKLNVNDSDVSKMIMSLLNDLGKSGTMISDVKTLQKLTKDKNLNFNNKTVSELEKIAKDYNLHLKNPKLDNVVEWINTLYRLIEEKKTEAKKGKGEILGGDASFESELLLNNSETSTKNFLL